MMHNSNLYIRKATLQDLEIIADIEKVCFPLEEAATVENFKERLKIYADHFWLLDLDGRIIGFIDGFVTNDKTISDEMFEQASLHDVDGDYQAVFGLNVLPEFRRRGYAATLVQALLTDAKQAERKGCILTCKERLISYYEKFGFKNQGISKSEHGGAVWFDMLLEF